MALLQAILDGLMLGGVYAVISIGLTLVFGVVSIVNFAQAQFLMVGMYVAYFAWSKLGLDPLLGSLLSPGWPGTAPKEDIPYCRPIPWENRSG